MRGAAQMVGGQGGRFLLQMVSAVALARLLTPDDHGLIAMVLAVTALADRLRDLGLSQATVQRDGLTHAQVSGLFWVNSGFGLVIAGLVVAGSGPLARFYDRPELVGVTIALSSTFILNGLAVQHVAVMSRNMRFGALAGVELLSTATGVAAAVGAAFYGAGYWSLVALHVVRAATRTAFAWAGSGWRPDAPHRAEGLGSLLSFGGKLSVTNLLNYAARNLDNVLIGRVWGAAALGVYSKAYYLLLLPLQQLKGPISNVALPTLSLLVTEPERYRHYYRRAVSTMAMLAMPPIAVGAALADDLVLLALGPAWQEVGPLFRILAFAALLQVVTNTNQWLYVSTGHVGRMVRFALISRPLVVVAFLVGLPWGARGVAIAYVISQYVLLLPSTWHATRRTALSVGHVIATAWPPYVVSVLAYLLVAGLRSTVLSTAGAVEAVTAGAVAAVALLSVVVLVWARARREVRELVDVVRSLFSRERPVLAG